MFETRAQVRSVRKQGQGDKVRVGVISGSSHTDDDDALKGLSVLVGEWALITERDLELVFGIWNF